MKETVYEVPSENMKKWKTITIAVVIGVFIGILGLNCFYTVKEQEQAVLLTLGQASTVSESGLHFKVPFIQKVRKVDTTIKGFTMGYNQNTNATIEEEALMITSDYNFINVDFFIEYQVSDPIKALYASQDPTAILRNIAQSSIRTVIGSTPVDEVLTTGKSEIQAQIKDMIAQRLEKDDIGIFLVNITMQDAEPPTEEVMQAFKAVETAKQGKETALNNANKYKNEKIPAAAAQVDKILQEAEAAKQERINEANGQVSRFNKMYAEYVKFPAVTKQRMFYETMEEILPDLEVIIDSGSNGVQKILPLDSFANIQAGSGSQASE
jgi:membrane protease subunit HflK